MNRTVSAYLFLFLMFALVLSACGGNATVTVAPTLATQVCLVPNVVGMDKAKASEILMKIGLQPVEKYREDSTAPKDAIITQEPAADTRLKPCSGDIIIVVSIGAPPKPIDTPIPPTQIPTATPIPPTANVLPHSKYSARLFNVDDVATLFINEKPVYKAKWGQSGVEGNWNDFGHQAGDSGEIDITSLLEDGENALRFELWNESGCCGVSLSIEIKEDGNVIASDIFSMQDSSSGIKYNKTFSVIVK
jgi:hypothetical protein